MTADSVITTLIAVLGSVLISNSNQQQTVEGDGVVGAGMKGHNSEKKQARVDGDLDGLNDAPESSEQTITPKPYHGSALLSEHQNDDVIADRFMVRKVLGGGSFGIVYLVYDRECDEAAALKTFRAEYLSDPIIRKAFEDEVRLWIEIEPHHYILAAKWVESVAGRLYVKMDYIEPDEFGRVTLHDYLAKTVDRPPPNRLLTWAIQVCFGMEHANRNGVKAHCDLKPSNILISSDRSVRITDFGLALAACSLEDKGAIGVHEGFCGTSGYIAPELLEGKAPDQCSDIFSFGIVLWQLAMNTQFLPIPIPAGESLIVYNLNFVERFLQGIPQPPALLRRVIHKCLLLDPAKRYKDFAELRTDLEELLWEYYNQRVVMPEQIQVDAQLLVEKASGYLATNDPSRAISLNKQAVDLVPGYSVAWNNLSASYFRTDQIQEALAAVERSLALVPTSCKALLNKAVFLRHLGRFDAAHQIYNKIIEQNPCYSKAWTNKGILYRYEEQHELAQECYEKAIEIDRLDPVAWNCLASASRRLGDYTKAIRCYKTALKINPFDSHAFNGLGIVYFEQEKYAKAAQQFELGITFNPRSSDIHANLARTLVRLKQYGDAFAHLETALSLSNTAWPWFCKAEYHFHLGEIQIAADATTQALARSTTLAETWFLEGQINERLGLYDKAIISYQRFLALALKRQHLQRNQAEVRIIELQGRSAD